MRFRSCIYWNNFNLRQTPKELFSLSSLTYYTRILHSLVRKMFTSKVAGRISRRLKNPVLTAPSWTITPRHSPVMAGWKTSSSFFKTHPPTTPLFTPHPISSSAIVRIRRLRSPTTSEGRWWRTLQGCGEAGIPFLKAGKVSTFVIMSPAALER